MQTHRHQEILSLLPVTHPAASPNHHLQRSQAPLSTLRPYHQNTIPTPPNKILEMTKTKARRKDKPHIDALQRRQATTRHTTTPRRSNPPPSSLSPLYSRPYNQPNHNPTHTHRNIGTPASPSAILPPCTTKHAVPHVVLPTSNMMEAMPPIHPSAHANAPRRSIAQAICTYVGRS